MSDHNSNPPFRARGTERYAELSDLLGDLSSDVAIAPRPDQNNAPDTASLESQLASVDANYPLRPREVTIPGANSARIWQAAPGSFSRATPIAAPLAPQALDAWNLRPALNTTETQVAPELFATEPTANFAPAIMMPEPETPEPEILEVEALEREILDEDAFQSVLEGLEGDIFDDEELVESVAPALEAGFSADVVTDIENAAKPDHQVEFSPANSYLPEPYVEPANYVPQQPAISAAMADVEVAEAFDPVADFDSAFEEPLFEDMPAENDFAVYSEPLSGQPVTTIQNTVEPEFEEIEPVSSIRDQYQVPDIAAGTAVAGAGLATILGTMRANASRETPALTGQLPATAFPASIQLSQNAEPVFPDVISPYDDVPVTGSLKVPDFVVAEASIPQRSPDFDEFQIEDFHPAPIAAVDEPNLKHEIYTNHEAHANHEVIVHEPTRSVDKQNEFDELAEIDFADAFEKDFNPTDELASIVGSNVDEDPLLAHSKVEEFAPMPAMPPIMASRPAKGKWLAFGALGLALVGALAIYGAQGDSTDNGAAPVIVRADNEPVKVAPENPGGTVVPNQDRVVFNEVSGGNAVPEQPQETLVDGRQEPAIAAAPVKEEDRVLNGDTSAELTAESGAAIAPRAVQTVTVRPDGTLVANEPVAPTAEAPQADIVPEARPEAVAAQPMPEPAPEVAADVQAPAGAAPVAENPVAENSEAEAPLKEIAEASVQDPQASEPNVPVRAVELKPVTQKLKVKAKPDQSAAPAEALDVVPSRPSDQPVNIVNPEAPSQPVEQQTASADAAPQADALAAGAYAIQIASTPSEAAATSTLRTLSGKFGSILGGKDYAIQRAEVPGKGTVYRVRILAGSKADAAKLCTRYKSAGGSCFVTR